MRSVFLSFPLALKMIFKDPINLLLALCPTLIALMLYLLTVTSIYRNSDRFVSMFRGYIYTQDQAHILAKVLTAILIIFIFFLMSWTFVIVVGIIAAPFNSLLSSRIEKKLTNELIEINQQDEFKKIGHGMMQTFKNEFKKLILIFLMGGFSFLMNFFPFLYPAGIFLLAMLISIQFLDYSWSRHDLHLSTCLKDLFLNIVPYSISGFFFLIIITVPIINAFIPALATSYFTVLWLYRQKKILP